MGRYFYPDITPGRRAVVSTHGYWFIKEGDRVVLDGKTEELGLPHHPGMDDIAVDDPHLDAPDDGWEYIRGRLLEYLEGQVERD
jgi:hypothetical protein